MFPNKEQTVSDTGRIVQKAYQLKQVVPAFNIPFLPMLEPVARALRDMGAFGLIQVARLEWEKFGSESLEAVRDTYERFKDERYMRLHLDHVPVIDEDGLKVDYIAIIQRAIAAGYQSVMVDGSRLSLADNITATKQVVELAHRHNLAVEAELGAVMGHEAGPLPPYEELMASGQGFTSPDDAARFISGTGVDWLSVAIGNIHGAISEATRNQPKLEAWLDIPRLAAISARAGIPLVLHGGSGIKLPYIHEAIRNGIAKINIGTTIRKAYENARAIPSQDPLDAVYRAVTVELTNLNLKNTASRLLQDSKGTTL